MVTAALVFAVLLSYPLAVFAEVAVETDRPDVATSTSTVPAGYVQFEGGYRYTRQRIGGTESSKRSAAESTVRVGLTPAFELRLDGDAYVDLGGADPANGVGDILLAAKWRLRDSSEVSATPSVAVLPFVKLPTADAPIGSERPDFGLLGLFGFPLPAALSLDVNLGIAAVGQADPGGFLVQGLAAVSMGRKLLDVVTVFAEVFGATRAERGGRASVGADAGVIWLVSRRVALDAAAETSLAGRGPDFGLRVGLTVLVGP